MRDTFAHTEDISYRMRAAATMLDVSENTLRGYLKDSEMDVRRQSDSNPKSPAVRLFSLQNIFDLAAWRRKQGFVKPVSDGPIMIAVDIIKGGVGKSTTTAEVGVQLALSGYRVLMVDLDSQANLTQLMGYESDLDDEDAVENDLSNEAIVKGTFYHVCDAWLKMTDPRGGAKGPLDPCIKWPYGPNGPALIPSDTYFGDLEQLISLTKGTREALFRTMFQSAIAGEVPGFDLKQFDFILFDCPPAVSLVAGNALAASDYIIAPVKMDSFAVKGVSRLVGEIKIVEKITGNRPKMVILPTHYSQNLQRVARMWRRMQAYRSSLLDDQLFISTSEMFPKSLEEYMPLTLQSPTAAPVQEYRRFTEHLLRKISSDSASKLTTEGKAA